VDTSFTWNVQTTRVVRVQFAPTGQDTIELNVTEENAESVAAELEQVAAAIRSSLSGSMPARPYVSPYPQPAHALGGGLVPAAPQGAWFAQPEDPR